MNDVIYFDTSALAEWYLNEARSDKAMGFLVVRSDQEEIWWRCRDLNPGHCGYEPHALTD